MGWWRFFASILMLSAVGVRGAVSFGQIWH